MTEESQSEQEQPKSERASRLMNDMIKGLRDLGNAAMEKAEVYGKIATEKAEELTKQGKLKLDIHQLNRSRTKALAELGELVINLSHADKLAELSDHENYIALSKTVAELDADIKAKEIQAAQAAAEGAEADTDS